MPRPGHQAGPPAASSSCAVPQARLLLKSCCRTKGLCLSVILHLLCQASASWCSGSCSARCRLPPRMRRRTSMRRVPCGAGGLWANRGSGQLYKGPPPRGLAMLAPHCTLHVRY